MKTKEERKEIEREMLIRNELKEIELRENGYHNVIAIGDNLHIEYNNQLLVDIIMNDSEVEIVGKFFDELFDKRKEKKINRRL